ncbi:MAG: NUDIX hydrolase [Chloroflexi bacterium]|nr:NUDIX hydrolase [Chloroflexota bacterium]
MAQDRFATLNREPTHVVLAVVVQIRGGRLQTLLWQRAREPDAGRWSLPGGVLGAAESLEASIRRHLAAKVDVAELSHLEQLQTLSEPDRHPDERQIATAYLGLVPSDADPSLPADTAWHAIDALPPLAFDHQGIVQAARDRLRAKLSYTNIGFAIAPAQFTLAELRDLYAAALGRAVTATNLQRILVRRHLLEPLAEHRAPTSAGGRPARLFRFVHRSLEITDEFAVLRPRS